MWRIACGVIVAIGALATGCAPATPARNAAPADGAAQQAPRATKTLTIAQLNGVQLYGPWDFSNTSGGGAALAEIHTVGLVTDGRQGGVEPRLAEKLPSFDDGSISILPDGRLQTIWKLRPDAKWQDGTPLTADDLAFSFEIFKHPELLSTIDSAMRQASEVRAQDPRTLLVTFRSTYYRARDIGHRDLWPYPRHLLAEAFDGEKAGFLKEPYFTTDYVNLGPFRLVEFGLGQNQVFEAFDGYFLGRPQIDRVILRTISDSNTILANLKAGAIDIAGERTLPPDTVAQIRREWNVDGGGTVADRQENWWYAAVQFSPEFGRPPVLSQDVRIRRALVYGLDRETVGETLLAGLPDTSADSFMRKNDPRAAAVGAPFAAYRYDVNRAVQEFAGAGWRAGSDGRLVNQAGEQLAFEVRAPQVNAVEVALVSNYWRQLGADVSELLPAPALYRDREWKSKFPGVEISARNANEKPFLYLDSRLHPGPENRWEGPTVTHYANPALDRLIDSLQRALDEAQQGQILRQLGEIGSNDLPLMPLYFNVASAPMLKGVRALGDDYAASGGVGTYSRNSHTWDRD
ncbi:MAG: hypothetical protein HW416_1155 [Chloroflexi bacterium]|nr:hypothetical protein [Chloroflexota bacterium]